MAATHPSPDDPVGAFVPGPPVRIEGRRGGPLEGRRVAVKDVIDVQSTVTGAGNLVWASTHPPAAHHARCVARLLEAGADVVGKGVCAEFAYSLSGDNAHFGMPVNSAAPDRNPGGSTSGPAAAVAAGLADLGIGTDTLGSIRIPASYCGLVGYRPTWGAISTNGVLPLASSFDTVGVLATDARLLAAAARVLLDRSAAETRRPVASIRLVSDARARVEPAIGESLTAAAHALAREQECAIETVRLFDDPGTYDDAMQAFSDIQSVEVWQAYGPWIESHDPQFGPGVGERFEHAATVTIDQKRAAETRRATIAEAVLDALGDGGVLAFPTAGLAPLRTAGPEELQKARLTAGHLSSLAGLASAPAVSILAAPVDGAPVGLTLLAAPGDDGRLLDLVAL
ncbi:MAG: amidase family protein [Acidimicrobiia bacterium]